MVKNIVFDIGDVILNFDFNRVVDKYTSDPQDKEFILNNILNTKDWQGFTLIDKGYLTIDEAITIVLKNTNHKKDELITKVFKHYFLYCHFNEQVLDLIKRLKTRYKIYLLSNINEYTFNFIKDSGLFERVDGYILSFQVHQVKPEEEIYKNLIHKYNIKAYESLFIDDTQDNIKTAKNLGFEAIHALPNNYEDLINKLHEKLRKE